MPRIAHLLAPHTTVSLFFSSAFPNGGMNTAAGVVGARALISFGGPAVIHAPPDCPPGMPFIVRTNVIARLATAGGGTSVGGPPLNDSSKRWNYMPEVKVRIGSCDGEPNDRIIDAGRSLLVPGPSAMVEVLAPPTFFDVSQQPNAFADESAEIMVFARACPCVCGGRPVPSQLIEWRSVGAGASSEELIYIVPRGARSLILGTVPAGPTAINFDGGDGTTAFSDLLGLSVFTPAAAFQGPLPMFPLGSPSSVRFTPTTTAPGIFQLRWEIEGDG